MSWRVARSLLVLRAEVDAAAPGRSKASDGTIGDAAHATRTSDHNPYIRDANGIGVVRALDVTHDPARGCDAGRLAEHVRQLGAAGDPRVRYVIWNRRIASARDGWRWRPYSGSNPHTLHVHISVVEGTAYDSTAPWGWDTDDQEDDDMPLTDDDVNRIAAAVERRLLSHLEFRDRVHWNPMRKLLDAIARDDSTSRRATLTRTLPRQDDAQAS